METTPSSVWLVLASLWPLFALCLMFGAVLIAQQ
jgi:hypothetical protein